MENPLRNYSYVIEFGRKAICVDPFYADKIVDFIQSKNLELISIINTHEHHDHIEGNLELKKMTGCEIWVYREAIDLIPDSDKVLRNFDKILLDENSYLEIIYTPGHTYCHLSLKVFENKKLTGIITGDTLFNAGVGNCYSGDPEVLCSTIFKHFKDLPDDVKLYPGHDYIENNCEFTLNLDKDNKKAKEMIEKVKKCNHRIITDMKTEREINLFLQTKTREEFVKLRKIRNLW